MPAFDGLGRALRWVRQRQGKKQYEVAELARITKAMLSSYENEKQRPTLETLERILRALDVDLDYLAYSMRAVRYEDARRQSDGQLPVEPLRTPALDSAAEAGIDVHRLLGLSGRLSPAEEQALAQMLFGFHSLLRYIVAQAPRPEPVPLEDIPEEE